MFSTLNTVVQVLTLKKKNNYFKNLDLWLITFLITWTHLEFFIRFVAFWRTEGILWNTIIITITDKSFFTNTTRFHSWATHASWSFNRDRKSFINQNINRVKSVHYFKPEVKHTIVNESILSLGSHPFLCYCSIFRCMDSKDRLHLPWDHTLAGTLWHIFLRVCMFHLDRHKSMMVRLAW